MNIFVLACLLFAVLGTMMCDGQPVSAPLGPCECAVFGSQTAAPSDVPVLKQQPMNVTCEQSGKETCEKMCRALAEAAKVRGPTLLCASVQHVDALMASIFARSCDNEEWTYTGLSSPDAICCHDGEPVTCKTT